MASGPEDGSSREDEGERREAQADDDGVVAESVSEDRQRGEDRGKVRRGRGDGDHHAFGALYETD